MERGDELIAVVLAEDRLPSSKRLIGHVNETSLAPMTRLVF